MTTEAQVLDDTKAKADAEAKSNAEKLYKESEMKEAIARRDSALAEKRKLEEELKLIKDREIAEKEQFKEAYEKIKPDYEQTLKERDELKSKVDAITQAQEAKVADAVSKLSDADKTEFEKFIAKLSLDDRLAWVEAHASKVMGGGTSPAPSRAVGVHSEKNRPRCPMRNA